MTQRQNRPQVPVELVQHTDHPGVTETFERLAKGPVGVVNLHRTLAHSPEVFARFIDFAHALRFKTEPAPVERELAILRVLALHDGHYETAHHRRMALAAGASQAQLDGLEPRDGELDASLYDARTLAVLRYATAFARNAGVAPEIAHALTAEYDDRQVVELSLTLSLYLGLAHFTNALGIPVD